MTNLEETALRNEWRNRWDEPKVLTVDGVADYWLAKMKAHESEEKERIASRLEHMFANAPETWHAIKQIIYSN